MFVRWGGQKYVDQGIVFSASKTEGSVCSFWASKALVETLDGRQLTTAVEVLDAFWRCRTRLQAMALDRYAPGAQIALDHPAASPLR